MIFLSLLNDFFKRKPMIKSKFYLSILLCLSSLICFAQYGDQFENRGFESWANFGSSSDTYEPVHWHSGMTASGSYSGWLSKQIDRSNAVRPGSTGSWSVKLWPKSVMFTIANGNLTNGRMNAGSMSVTGAENYNYTQRSEVPFNTPISTVPDSLTIWVCFRSNNTINAQVRAVVHGNADFRCISNGSMEPADKLVASALVSFPRTSTSGGAMTWKRLSIPFTQNGPCNDPRYILLSATTHETPGEGSTSDDLYLDDVLLVYNPSIQIEDLNNDYFVIGDEMIIRYNLSGTMSPDNLNKAPNEVIAQLSDANGSFGSPVELGRVTTNTSGSLDVTIPMNASAGEQYRVRLVTTNYPMVSQDNGFDIHIVTNDAVDEDLAEEEIISVEVFDLLGRPMRDNDLAPGIYIKMYRTTKGYTVQKFMVQ